MANTTSSPPSRQWHPGYYWRLWSLRVLDFFAYIGEVNMFGALIIRRAFTPPMAPWSQVVEQFALLVRRCFGPVFALSFTIGAVISLEASSVFKLVSAEPLLGGISAMFTLRELGPVMAGIMIAAQGGTSVATEIGAMKIRQELDALELMATDPIKFAIAPRFFAFLMSAPLLTLLANLAGILGAFLMGMAVSTQTPYTYLHSILDYVTLLDIWNGMLKAVFFGYATGVISCYNGINVRGGSADVGRAANRSVVFSMIAILMLNYFVTTIFFGTATGFQKF